MQRRNVLPVFLLAALGLLTGVRESMCDERTVWDFETDVAGWTARAASVSVTRVEGLGAKDASHACLHVVGPIASDWNYASSQQIAVPDARLYRLSAWLRVDRLGADTPAPYLKCEFVSFTANEDSGQVHTSRYDTSRLGTWQRIDAEFRLPETTTQVWLALEKGTNAGTDLDAYLDDIQLEPIARLSVLDKFRLSPNPQPLEQMRGVHPRLYLTSERVAELREAIRTTHLSLWNEVREAADQAANRQPPPYIQDDGRSGQEQLWQRDVGNTLPTLAMAYVLTGESKYLDAARRWALAACAYETWGLGPIDGMDLAAGHQLFGLAIVYDWCYGDLGEESRATIRQTLCRRASAMFEAAATEKVWWHNAYLQNHLWVNVCGLAATGMALYGEVDDASMWIGLPLAKFRRTMEVLGPDGASHEGVGYWEYGVEYLLKFMDLARQLLDVDLFDVPWWKNAARYAQYMTLPRNAWSPRNCIVDLADCPRSHWYGPDHVLRFLARQYRDGHAQWLALEVDGSDVAAPSAGWLNLVWYDPSVKAVSPAELPAWHTFDDLGIVSARTDWSGDESLMVFKCGPPLGHQAASEFRYDPGGGHVHPDANHFVLFAEGEWLIRDDGYRAKATSQHNTLLVDGHGQLGEGAQWYDATPALLSGSRPSIVHAQSTPEFDHFAGNATQAYVPELGLTRYVRHVLFLKPDVLLIIDDIALDKPHALELRFHPEQERCERDGPSFVMLSKRSVLRVEPLVLDGVELAAETVASQGRHGEDSEMFAIRVSKNAQAWRSAVAISWTAQGKQPTKCRLEAAEDRWRIVAGQRQWLFQWASGRLEPVVSGPPVESAK